MERPSKKFIVAVIAAVLLLGAILIFEWQNTGEEYFTPIALENIVKNSAWTKDADGDGLMDWEEDLWKTDRENSDTDSDGTRDGDEIKNRRDPTRAGPEDALDLETVEKKVNEETEADLTPTDKLSRLAFTRYLGALQRGETLGEDDLASLLTDTLRAEPVPRAPRIGERDLTASADESPLALRAYGNEVGSLIKKHEPKGVENELVILDRAATSNNESDLGGLRAHVNALKALRADLARITVPASLLTPHASYINGLALRAAAIELLSGILSDPIGAMRGMPLYDRGNQETVDAFLVIAKTLRDRGVSWSQNESGYVFTRILGEVGI